MNNFETEYDHEEQLLTIPKLRERLNNLGKHGLDFIITDLNECHNSESALTLETLNIDDTIISIPINGFKYCYTIKELIDLIENAMNKYESANPGYDATINNITVNDLYTNVKIPTDILQKVYNYYNGIIEVDTIERIFADTFNTYPDEIDELQDFMIELIQNNKNLIIGSTYNFKTYMGTTKMTPLQRACDRNLTNIAMYILNNFTPKECLLNYVDNNERTALMYAINGIYKNTDNIRSMNKVTMKILEYSPDENNLFYIGGDLHDNKTALMIACHRGLTDIALKILEQKPSIDYVNVRSDTSSYNQEGLYYEESTEGKTAIDYAVRNDMDAVLNKLVELYGPSMKRERKSDMFGFIDDLYGYDSRLLEFEPRGHLGGKVIRFKRKSNKKRRSLKRSYNRTSKK
jgi:ankyrin repeat protein